jgi:hypothetical protein
MLFLLMYRYPQLIAAPNSCLRASGCVSVSSFLTSSRHTKRGRGIRRAVVNSFGYIAKSLGPQDVLSVLLTNLRVQERQSHVCTTVAIAIVHFTAPHPWP